MNFIGSSPPIIKYYTFISFFIWLTTGVPCVILLVVFKKVNAMIDTMIDRKSKKARIV